MAIAKNSPLTKVFERRLWSSYPVPSFRYDQAYWEDPKGFKNRLDQAWRSRDFGVFAQLAPAYARNAAGHPKLVGRMAFSLSSNGCFEDALALLRRHSGALKDDPGYWLELARARAGTGLLEEAAAAAHRALAITPEDPEVLALLAELDTVNPLVAGLQELTEWSDFSRLAANLYDLGALERASAVIRHFLVRRLTPPKDPDELLRAVQMALAGAHPENAYAIIGDLVYAYGKGDERRVLRDALSVLSGDTDEGWAGKNDQACKHDRELRLCVVLAFLAAGRRRVAIERLSHMCERFNQDQEARLILAQATGEELLSITPVRFRGGKGRRIFDLIMFNNERELLHAKLAEEDPWVDRFVIVEANRTFTGLEKPFYFEQWKSEFSRYAKKIIHVKVDRFPSWADSAWAREFHQRDMGVTGASGRWSVDDLVMLTDADEIVDRRALEGFDGEYAALMMGAYRYYLNYHEVDSNRHTGVILRAMYLQKFGASFARNMLRSYRLTPRLMNAGWHFTSVADPAGLAAKIRSYSHQEYAHLDEAYFESVHSEITSGTADGWERCPIDDRFPAYIRENQDALAPFILPLEQTKSVG